MKAIQFRQFGSPEVLEWVELPIPEPADNELLIKIYAAGVNPIDAKIREGSSFVAKQLKLPSGLGYDTCGEVVTVAKGIKKFKPGDKVLGSVGRFDHPSAYAEYCVANPGDIIIKPENLTEKCAAALPIAGLTAWQALHRFGKIQQGERVLIQAGAGGVGHLAVQLAKLAGAYVIATASSRHTDFLKQLGADEVVDYTKQPFENILNSIDCVIDLVGSDVGLRSLHVLKAKGRMVTVPSISRDEIIAKAKGLHIDAMGILVEADLKDLQHIANLIADKKIQLKIAQTFSMAEAGKAHQILEEGHTQGKIVLTVSNFKE